ncbi:MAG: hypothetical protein ACXABH_12425 [Candidatus Thorarchaeota archaeon]
MSSRRISLSIVTILSFVLILGYVQSPVAATEPENIVLTYNPGSQTLAVNISHDVANNKTHYIENIEIWNNELSILNRTYANQSYHWGMYDTFTVSTTAGDNLTVTATCKRGHSLTQWLIVSSTTSTSSSPTDTTTTTQPTNGTGSPGTPMDTGPAIVAVFAISIAFIIFFAWLKPEYVPESLKQLGSRIRPGADWFGQKMNNLAQQIKTRLPST